MKRYWELAQRVSHQLVVFAVTYFFANKLIKTIINIIINKKVTNVRDWNGL